MSTINVNNLSGRGGATPNLPDGAVISGVATVTNLKPTNVNVSGAVTATTFDGSLKSTGTPTLGLGVTINASGVAISGVCTAGIVSATTFYGSGSGLTGVGETIAPWNYNPDIGDTAVTLSELTTSGIGITFNKKVVQGSSGTATLKIVNAGAAGTTIQSWGVSSTTYDVTVFTLDALVSDLTLNQTYQLDIPDGFIVDTNETSYVGTAWTFVAQGPAGKLWAWGNNGSGELGINSPVNAHRSSPVQVAGTTWSQTNMGGSAGNNQGNVAITDTGEMWLWGNGNKGFLGQNSTTSVSSPIQLPGTWKSASGSYFTMLASKTDGTLWSWGYGGKGELGQNAIVDYSSPVQIPGTTWTGTRDTLRVNRRISFAIKTDGTLWSWGNNNYGQLGVNNRTNYSSPIQIPGTTWSKVGGGEYIAMATKTDGTLWAWGQNELGVLANGSPAHDAHRSSPVQIPGTTWNLARCGSRHAIATRTDGTLWAWGYNNWGQLGHNNAVNYSSPVQVPGTTWNKVDGGDAHSVATKTDGTLWTWGFNEGGELGQNNNIEYSSPTQIPGTEWTGDLATSDSSCFVIQIDPTP